MKIPRFVTVFLVTVPLLVISGCSGCSKDKNGSSEGPDEAPSSRPNDNPGNSNDVDPTRGSEGGSFDTEEFVDPETDSSEDSDE